VTAPAPFPPASLARLHQALRDLISSGGSPGGVIAAGTAGGDRDILAAGIIAPECGSTAPDAGTWYDIASLTKVVATWPLAGQAWDSGRLDRPVREFLPAIGGPAPSGEVTIRQLLTHTSGLRPATRLDQYLGTSTPLHELICCEPLDTPPGPHRYINRGFILLGLALAHTQRAPLHELAAAYWESLGMKDTTYGPVSRTSQVAPTEQVLPGAPRIWGSPHDQNAALMGGVAGHAGVFSTPADLATYAEHLLTSHAAGTADGTWLRSSMIPHAPIAPGAGRGLAWVLTHDHTIAGHHGFTGTSLLLNPQLGRYLVICTNAVYHGRPGERLRPLRDLALREISTP
jgi:CubicO group peptidase (beta-lactamase class C family)